MLFRPFFVSLALFVSLSVSFTTAFAPLQSVNNISLRASSSSATDVVATEISDCLEILNRAADTRTQDPELVYEALVKLEKLQRQKAKTDPTVAQEMLENLDGDWRLVFTTGTAETQKKIKGKVNYFPLKVSYNIFAVLFCQCMYCTVLPS